MANIVDSRVSEQAALDVIQKVNSGAVNAAGRLSPGAEIGGVLFTGENGNAFNVLNAAWISPVIPINELQAYINGLPKFINRSTTIRAAAGTLNTDITLDRFYGPGVLNIFAVDANGSTLTTTGETHNIIRFIINQCTNQQINIQGFNCTAESGNCISFGGTHAVTIFKHCSAVAGSSATSNFHGVYATGSQSIIVENCLFSNKNRVFDCGSSAKIFSVSNTGTNNVTVARAWAGGIIQIGGGSPAGEIAVTEGGVVLTRNGIPAVQIVTNADRRFVTDAQISKWDAGSPTFLIAAYDADQKTKDRANVVLTSAAQAASAIQAALTSFSGVVQLSSGSFDIGNSTITMSSHGAVLQGAGETTQLFSSSNNGILQLSANDLIIRRIRIQSISIRLGGQTGSISANRPLFEDVTVTGNSQIIVYLAQDILVDRVSFINTSKSDNIIYDRAGTNVTLTVQNCNLRSASGEHGALLVIQNNKIDRLRMHNNRVDTNGADIYLVDFRGNIVDWYENITFSNNVNINGPGAMFAFRSVQKVPVRNIVVENNNWKGGMYGLQIAGQLEGVRIKDNYFENGIKVAYTSTSGNLRIQNNDLGKLDVWYLQDMPLSEMSGAIVSQNRATGGRLDLNYSDIIYNMGPITINGTNNVTTGNRGGVI